jgi:hypothetical protein
LIVSLANTSEPLYLVNRSGNCSSSEGAAKYTDKAMDLCDAAGFENILIRGDTDFSQTRHLDRWDGRGASFIFGNAMPNLIVIADNLSEGLWMPFLCPAKYEVRTQPRRRLANVKERIVIERQYENSGKVMDSELSAAVLFYNYRVVFAYLHVATCQKSSELKILDQ